jgi:putative nucleotidyltransferase with HDIG domain
MAALLGLAVALTSVVLVIPLLRFDGALQEGDVASRTFVAAHGQQFESEALTEAARTEKAAAVGEDSLPVDLTIRDQQRDRATRYLDQVRGIVARSELTAQQKQDQISNLTGSQALSGPERTALQSLTPPELQTLSQRVATGIDALLSHALKQADIEAGVREQVNKEIPPPVPDDARGSAAAIDAQRTAFTAVLRSFSVETFKVDTAATERKRAEARQSVAPVIRSFSTGQVIVTEGQRISAQDIEALKATGVIEDGLDLFSLAGGAVIAAGLGLFLGVYAYLFQPFRAPVRRRMVVVVVTFAVVMAAARVALPLVTPDTEARYFAFALPVSIAAIIAACFADLSFAVVVAIAAGLFAAFVGGTAPQIAGSSYVGSLQSLELGMAYTACGMAGAAAVNRASRLGRFAFAAVVVALSNAAVMGVFWLVSAQRDNLDLAWIALAAGVHGLAAAVISVGLFVVLAMVFGVTTRIQLMELAQSEHPLLRQLQEEAPGTYHHSTLVGALAERAATRIGADSLLVRVGAYYHDIGKLAMPDHYVENMLDGHPSPHDSMPPAESAKVIRAHVTNGLELAKKHRLPSVVRDFIPQHHGTRLVTYFYRNATAAGAQVNLLDYRYEGPKPQTREAAIVMLADSSEAVVRSRPGDNARAIDEAVDSVFAERLSEGQLDECDITLRDLREVAASFKATLRAVYHPRVQYPSPTPEEIATLARGETPMASR